MRLRWQRLDLTLRHPFVTAAAVRTQKQTIWVRLEHDHVEGWGESVPADFYGQSLDSSEHALREIADSLPPNLDEPERFIDRLLARFDDQRATIAAVDAAVHDWIGKRDRRSTVASLGLDPDNAPRTSVTLGIDKPEKILEKMAEIAAFPIWKVKIGTQAENESLALIREHAPQKIIRVDANMGWPAKEALDRLHAIAPFAPELVEQPCARDDLTTLQKLKSARIAPIVADESCVKPKDVSRVAHAVDGINIKLSKCGGILEARRMIAAARACGLKIMLGCMIESSLGIAAAAQLAPAVDWIDLDGHLLIANDPFTGLGGELDARLSIGCGPGLGVTPVALSKPAGS